MRPDNDNTRFHNLGCNGSDCRTCNTKLRHAQITEYQSIVEDDIHHHGNNGCCHRHPGLLTFPENIGIDLTNRKGNHGNKHDIKIGSAIAQGRCCLTRRRIRINIETNKIVAEEIEHPKSNQSQHRTDDQPEPDRVPLPVHITLTEELRAEDSRARHCSKYRKIIHKGELIGYRNTAHLRGTNLSNHNIVEQTHEIRHHILQNHGYRNRAHIQIELPVAYELVL